MVPTENILLPGIQSGFSSLVPNALPRLRIALQYILHSYNEHFFVSPLESLGFVVITNSMPITIVIMAALAESFILAGHLY